MNIQKNMKKCEMEEFNIFCRLIIVSELGRQWYNVSDNLNTAVGRCAMSHTVMVAWKRRALIAMQCQKEIERAFHHVLSANW